HSGDSACSIPAWSLSLEIQDEIRRQTIAMARDLGVIGLMNVQFAVVGDEVYVLEVNPRASRTVPFVSKAIGRPLAKLAARAMAGETLAQLGFTEELIPAYMSVKEAVFPFIKFPGVDTLLGPEMKSTGEVMGIDRRFGLAFAKAEEAAGNRLPSKGTVLVSVRPEDRERIGRVARRLIEADLALMATEGTCEYLSSLGLECESVKKVSEGAPNTVDAIRGGKVCLVINTVGTPEAVRDSFTLRRAALETAVPYFTTIAGAAAAAEGIFLRKGNGVRVTALQDFHAGKWS
ncbi:MAG TPA: carbamoyl phosphate synthase large subunit, partial [Candidatus Binatia bacterium]|nr:carbamoyl phosphate synthase large subunit [Candidatus Binatia bacterium]